MARIRKTNTRGFEGVSFNVAAGKWEAYIRVNGKRRRLGLHENAEAANTAVLEEKAKLPPPLSLAEVNAATLAKLWETVRQLHAEHGLQALAVPFLDGRNLYAPFRLRGVTHAMILAEFGATDTYPAWREQHRPYAGVVKPTWTWDRCIEVVREVMEKHDGELPTQDWFRKNGYSAMISAVHKTGHSFEKLRAVLGDFKTSQFRQSRSGIRWRSQPECSLSDFLYARGIEQKRGERYADANPEHAGHNRYDLHFRGKDGDWIDVEVWGNLGDLSEGRYNTTRAKKEAWRKGDTRFLGIESTDCLVEARLVEILEPYIGAIAPFRFDKATDKLIETAHWSSTDELVESCRQIAAQQPDGIFPNEQWLRKRGKYKDRPGETYNTLAVRINQWLGGTRKVRQLLGQAHASTTDWTPEGAVTAWRAFQAEHGISPSQAHGRAGVDHIAMDVLRQGARIYQATKRLGMVDEARQGKTGHKIKWTPETAGAAWKAFIATHGRTPTQCMSASRRKTLPRSIADEANQIYAAVTRLGLLKKLRDDGNTP